MKIPRNPLQRPIPRAYPIAQRKGEEGDMVNAKIAPWRGGHCMWIRPFLLK